MIRFDFSNTLIHLTRDRNGLSAKEVFRKILNEKKILGSNEFIRGKYNCVCFSETPISAIGQIIAQNDDKFKYGAYGFMFTKKMLFDIGARPVIYQPESDFNLLPEELKYRHVRFEIKKTDYTWEREWRIKIDFINLDSSTVTLIVPNRTIIEELKKEKEEKNIGMSIATNGIFGNENIEWHFIALEDLGIKIF